jgi:hypothetical protein
MTPAEVAVLETVKTDVTEQVQHTILSFLHETLPSIDIPDISHPPPKADAKIAEDEPLKFSVAKLKLGEVKIKKEDIAVDFGDLVKLEGGDS